MTSRDTTESGKCWLCGCEKTHLKRAGNARAEITSAQFRITDANYGVTADIYQCEDCDFLFCPNISAVLDKYQQMDDPAYEKTRKQRLLQAERLIQLIRKYQHGGSLLDVGAGSGILLEAANAAGFTTAGVEPSHSLAKIAHHHGLNVQEGILTKEQFAEPFDVVTLIDVIEHVDTPVQLMQEISAHMNSNSICVVVTPDVNSLCARLLGYRWWHYRLAHISYFNRRTLDQLLDHSGLTVIATHRPVWYFPASYLFTRAMQYLPAALRVKTPSALDKITVPLNLFDSLLLVCRKVST